MGQSDSVGGGRSNYCSLTSGRQYNIPNIHNAAPLTPNNDASYTQAYLGTLSEHKLVKIKEGVYAGHLVYFAKIHSYKKYAIDVSFAQCFAFERT